MPLGLWFQLTLLMLVVPNPRSGRVKELQMHLPVEAVTLERTDVPVGSKGAGGVVLGRLPTRAEEVCLDVIG